MKLSSITQTGQWYKARFFSDLLPAENEFHITLYTFNNGKKDGFRPHWLGLGRGAGGEQIMFSRIFHCLVLQPKLLFFKYFQIVLNWNMDGNTTEVKTCLNSIWFYMQKSIPATSTYGSGRKIAKESQGIILLPNHTGSEVLKDKINVYEGDIPGSI